MKWEEQKLLWGEEAQRERRWAAEMIVGSQKSLVWLCLNVCTTPLPEQGALGYLENHVWPCNVFVSWQQAINDTYCLQFFTQYVLISHIGQIHQLFG